MAGVELQEVRKSFGRTEVIKGVSTAVADGEMRVMLGPSGCGKSTVLRMIAGLEAVSAGTIRIGERVVNDLEPKDRDVAMVFQNYALYPHMSVYDNMAYGLRNRGTQRAEIERCEGLVHLLGARLRGQDGGAAHELVPVAVVAVGVGVDHGIDLARGGHRVAHRRQHLAGEPEVEQRVDQQRCAGVGNEAGVGEAPRAVGLEPRKAAGPDLVQTLRERNPAHRASGPDYHAASYSPPPA